MREHRQDRAAGFAQGCRHARRRQRDPRRQCRRPVARRAMVAGLSRSAARPVDRACDERQPDARDGGGARARGAATGGRRALGTAAACRWRDGRVAQELAQQRFLRPRPVRRHDDLGQHRRPHAVLQPRSLAPRRQQCRARTRRRPRARRRCPRRATRARNEYRARVYRLFAVVCAARYRRGHARAAGAHRGSRAAAAQRRPRHATGTDAGRNALARIRAPGRYLQGRNPARAQSAGRARGRRPGRGRGAHASGAVARDAAAAAFRAAGRARRSSPGYRRGALDGGGTGARHRCREGRFLSEHQSRGVAHAGFCGRRVAQLPDARCVRLQLRPGDLAADLRRRAPARATRRGLGAIRSGRRSLQRDARRRPERYRRSSRARAFARHAARSVRPLGRGRAQELRSGQRRLQARAHRLSERAHRANAIAEGAGRPGARGAQRLASYATLTSALGGGLDDPSNGPEATALAPSQHIGPFSKAKRD